MSEVTDWLVWVDIETTGLRHTRDEILELGLTITDSQLKPIASNSWTIKQYEGWEKEVEPFIADMHTSSGLVKEVETAFLNKTQVEGAALSFLRPYPRGVIPMAGSSVQFDRKFLSYQMPDLEEWFHYRNVDVSTIKELVKRWAPEVAEKLPEGTKAHRALPDIFDSIEELKYYRAHAFKI